MEFSLYGGVLVTSIHTKVSRCREETTKSALYPSVEVKRPLETEATLQSTGSSTPTTYCQESFQITKGMSPSDPPKGEKDGGSTGVSFVSTRTVQQTLPLAQLLGCPCVDGETFKAKEIMKIHMPKKGCTSEDPDARQRAVATPTSKSSDDHGQGQPHKLPTMP